MSPRYVKAAGHPGEAGLMTAPDCYDGYVPILADNAPNKVAARISMFLPFHRPIAHASRVTCPALLLICDPDSIAPASDAVKAASKMRHATVKHYSVGHFDVYKGEALKVSIKDQLRMEACSMKRRQQKAPIVARQIDPELLKKMGAVAEGA